MHPWCGWDGLKKNNRQVRKNTSVIKGASGKGWRGNIYGTSALVTGAFLKKRGRPEGEGAFFRHHSYFTGV